MSGNEIVLRFEVALNIEKQGNISTGQTKLHSEQFNIQHELFEH